MTTAATDLYIILGLTRHATQSQISHAYRSLVRRYHPDTRTPGDQAHNTAADATLQQVITAYAVLSDPDRRAAYDQRHVPSRLSTVTKDGPAFGYWIRSDFGSGTGDVDQPSLRAFPARWDPWPRR